jgi:hypothetical protein
VKSEIGDSSTLEVYFLLILAGTGDLFLKGLGDEFVCFKGVTIWGLNLSETPST